MDAWNCSRSQYNKEGGTMRWICRWRHVICECSLRPLVQRHFRVEFFGALKEYSEHISNKTRPMLILKTKYQATKFEAKFYFLKISIPSLRWKIQLPHRNPLKNGVPKPQPPAQSERAIRPENAKLGRKKTKSYIQPKICSPRSSCSTY